MMLLIALAITRHFSRHGTRAWAWSITSSTLVGAGAADRDHAARALDRDAPSLAQTTSALDSLAALLPDEAEKIDGDTTVTVAPPTSG